MKTHRTVMASIFLIAVLAVLLACNLPTKSQTAAVQNGDVQTAAALTVQAMLTKPAATATTGSESAPQETPQPTAPLPTTTPQPTNTIAPTDTPTPQPCNLATFIKDVTVHDGATFKPGEHFTKTWRLKNVGTCTWQNYSLVFDHGDIMGGPTSKPIAATVPPGQEVDISVDLVAPNAEGGYEGYWRLRDDKGAVFGLTNGNPFWVKIKVVNPTATPAPTATSTPTLPPPAMMVLDLYSNAQQAIWRNGQGTTLPFPGSNSDSRGFARYANQYLLEDGQYHTHVLETHPQWIDDGLITGTYQSVLVPPNAHFRAKIGFIAANNGGCGAGNVIFEVWAFYNNHPTRLYSQQKACNGHLLSVDISLAPLANRQVIFRLVVRANGSSAQDWAVWVNPNVATP